MQSFFNHMVEVCNEKRTVTGKIMNITLDMWAFSALKHLTYIVIKKLGGEILTHHT